MTAAGWCRQRLIVSDRGTVGLMFTPSHYDPNIINFTLTAHFDTCHCSVSLVSDVSHNAKSGIWVQSSHTSRISINITDVMLDLSKMK